MPMPDDLANKKVLLISDSKLPGGTQRIIVEKSATLSNPVAGDDYPTDTTIPASLVGKKILVLDQVNRLVINIEQAVAGIDFPTDGPADLERNFSVWAINDSKRLRLAQIYSIEKAQAGIDYPTDGPANLDRNFYVVVTVGSNELVRERL